METGWDGIERRQPGRVGRRAEDFQRERENVEMRAEIDRLKAVVEILADAVQALTALQNKPAPEPPAPTWSLGPTPDHAAETVAGGQAGPRSVSGV